MNYKDIRNNNLAMLTDFYELTMMQGYFFNFQHDQEQAVFEMFYRRQPFSGGYCIFAGLDPLLEAIESLKFSKEDLDYLNSQKIFRKEFLEFLSDFSFKGDVYSFREGSVVFPNEPLIRVSGTLIETQLIESIVLNFINFQTLIATKTARVVDIANQKPVLEFGLRRAQGKDGAISATRAAYIGGANATSNTLAGKLFNIPVSGTMAHSWVMNAESELDAFRKYAEIYKERSILLVDTFDTLKSGIPNAIRVFKELKKENPVLMGIRIDSGDLEYLSKEARKMLDNEGLPEVKIFVSSDIDEWIINQINDSDAPIDSWGVGTRMVTGGNDPALTGVYKVVARKNGTEVIPCIKISNQTEKITNPGIKNVMRFYNRGSMVGDLLYLEEGDDELMSKVSRKEPVRFNHPATEYAKFTLRNYDCAKLLLEKVMEEGRKISPPLPLSEIREFRKSEINSLDSTYRRLLNPHTYKVSLSDNLKNLKTNLIKGILENSG